MADYPFDKMYKKIMDNLDFVNLVVKNLYSTFPCILCDYNAHKFVLTDSGKVYLENEFCRNTISKVKLYMKVINVELV